MVIAAILAVEDEDIAKGALDTRRYVTIKRPNIFIIQEVSLYLVSGKSEEKRGGEKEGKKGDCRKSTNRSSAREDVLLAVHNIHCGDIRAYRQHIHVYLYRYMLLIYTRGTGGPGKKHVRRS